MRYVTVTAQELGHLREGLQVIESLNEYAEPTVEIYFYGLTDNSSLLDAVKEAVSYYSEEEIDEADVVVTEAVFIFRVSSDVLYYLTGSGLTLRDAEVVYIGGAGEGPRTVSISTKYGGVSATVGEFKTMALSRDEFGGEDFLTQYGTSARGAKPQEVVPRTAPATEEAKPEATPGREAVAPQKKSSLSSFDLDSWLRAGGF